MSEAAQAIRAGNLRRAGGLIDVRVVRDCTGNGAAGDVELCAGLDVQAAVGEPRAIHSDRWRGAERTVLADPELVHRLERATAPIEARGVLTGPHGTDLQPAAAEVDLRPGIIPKGKQ